MRQLQMDSHDFIIVIYRCWQEDLNGESIRKVLRALKKGEKVTPGPQNGRISCEPKGV